MPKIAPHIHAKYKNLEIHGIPHTHKRSNFGVKIPYTRFISYFQKPWMNLFTESQLLYVLNLRKRTMKRNIVEIKHVSRY